jgi:hypothetical protein
VGVLVGEIVGALLGDALGLGVGLPKVYVGATVGLMVGAMLGEAVGDGVGPEAYDGTGVGLTVGFDEGRAVGLFVGDLVGISVGDGVVDVHETTVVTANTAVTCVKVVDAYVLALMISRVKNVLELYRELYSKLPAPLHSSTDKVWMLTVMMSEEASWRRLWSRSSAELTRRRSEGVKAVVALISSGMLLSERSLRRVEAATSMLSVDSPVTSATVAVKAAPNCPSLLMDVRPPLMPRSMIKKENVYTVEAPLE